MDSVAGNNQVCQKVTFRSRTMTKARVGFGIVACAGGNFEISLFSCLVL